MRRDDRRKFVDNCLKNKNKNKNKLNDHFLIRHNT